MLVDLTLSCLQDKTTGQSECSLLLGTLMDLRNRVENNPNHYGPTAAALVSQANDIMQSIRAGMLATLEGLQPVQVPDGKGGYQTVYDLKTGAGEGQTI